MKEINKSLAFVNANLKAKEKRKTTTLTRCMKKNPKREIK